jgi:hypothetical protein
MRILAEEHISLSPHIISRPGEIAAYDHCVADWLCKDIVIMLLIGFSVKMVGGAAMLQVKLSLT